MIQGNQLTSVRDCTRIVLPAVKDPTTKPMSEAQYARKIKKLTRKEFQKAKRKTGDAAKTTAEQQAKHLQDFWAARGHTIVVAVKYVGKDSSNNPVYTVKTDMKNGLPK